MNTATQLSEPSTTNASKENRQETTGRLIVDGPLNCTRCGYAKSAHPGPIGTTAPYEYKGHPVCGEFKEVSTDHETKALRITEAKGGETDPAAGRDRGTTFLYYRGAFRVYFNRKEDKPRVVSIDNGSHAWEINCKTLKIYDVKLKSEFRLYAEPPDPCFWLEGHGAVTIDGDGNATIV